MASDRQVRERALDPARSFIVQAPAGSGKTEVLTQRFLRLLATVQRPERVLAITFTRKATQEMRTRVSARLAQAMSGARPEHGHDRQAVALAAEVLARDREYGWNLLGNPGRLRINTIDGLCAQLLSRDPVHGPRWSAVAILEDARALYREAVRRVFSDIDELVDSRVSEAQSAQDALVRLLVHLGGDAPKLERLLMDMLSRRSLWKRHLESSHEARATLLAERQRQALASFRRALGEALLDEAMAIAAELGFGPEGPAAGGDARLHAAAAFAQLMSTGQNKLRKPRGLNRSVFPGMDGSQLPALERLKEICAQWNESDAARDAVERMASMPPLDVLPYPGSGPNALLDDARSVLSLTLIELQDLMAESGRADFTAIADAALASLGTDTEPADILLAEDARIDHILMDEFQDTSHAQFKLIERLIAGWQEGDGRSLFLVGDPMQSIYRFREADVGFFNDVVRRGRLGQMPIEPLSLQSNFRSCSELIEWFNDTFPGVFPENDESDSGAVSYTAVRPELGPGGCVGHHVLTEGGPDQETRIAELIRKAREELGEPSIAILVRSREQVLEITSGLMRHGIEFEAVEIGKLAGRGVVQDLMILTRALVHPLDRVAWIALLRAPWCGLRIAEIHRVVGEDPSQEVGKAIEEAVGDGRLGANATARLSRLARIMAHGRECAGGHSLAERVQMCWIQLGGPLCCGDASDIENAETFFELLEETSREGGQEVVERLGEALENRFAASRPARVQIMTIHKAKGLEFDVVIVPGMERATRGSQEALIALQEFGDEERGRGVLMAALTPKSQAETSLYRYLQRVDAERARFESQRVLYVACTRARRQLHLIATVPLTSKGQASIRANTFLKLLETPFGPSLEAAVERSTGSPAVATGEPDEPPAMPLLRLQGPLPDPGLEGEPQGQPVALRELADREAVALGTVLHRWLELIHDHPQPAWDAARIKRSTASIRSSLLRAGAPEDSLDLLQARCKVILVSIVENEELTRMSPRESWSELPLFRRDGQGFTRHVIDLVARDETGALRIVDYKTAAPPEGDDAVAGLREEQLGRYRALVERLDSGPVAETRIEVLERGGSPVPKI